MALYINGNKTGGGGGNSNMRELTQAEYDALTTEEKNNGTVYYITDGDDGNGGYQLIQPIIYSKEEREVGVWTDGKPLYQKTFLGTVSGNSPEYTIDVSDLGIESIVDSSLHNTSNTAIQTPLYYYSSNDFIRWYSNERITEIKIHSSNNSGTYPERPYDFRLTIRYTKTTDVAGSGKWTPQGISAAHYSTEEQVVGTWVDGSTIYEKTFELSNSIIVNNSNWTSTGISKENINKIICCNGMTPDGTCWGDLCATPNVNSYINLLTGRNGDTEEVKWFTIQYTKTTT